MSEIERLRAEGDALIAKLKEATEALEQAQSCILYETPEDMSHEDARADTLKKIRAVLCSRLIECVNPYDKGEFEDGEVPKVDQARALLSRFRPELAKGGQT